MPIVHIHSFGYLAIAVDWRMRLVAVGVFVPQGDGPSKSIDQRTTTRHMGAVEIVNRP